MTGINPRGSKGLGVRKEHYTQFRGGGGKNQKNVTAGINNGY